MFTIIKSFSGLLMLSPHFQQFAHPHLHTVIYVLCKINNTLK
nr:MAG TPA: hypothetical protein [Bacteriophage sp.]